MPENNDSDIAGQKYRIEETRMNDCPIGLASALFNMTDEQFVKEYIRTGKVHADRLHQLNWTRVLWLYNQRPKQYWSLTTDYWRLPEQGW